ncbi:tetratricopeptide repeat protein [Nonomuraea sp. bgisy101]|uniref:tetratricopeptide repeat protein n=1 Tax=Nonomuraea sp. bgisy101 TaxID=3413784 RepID=UPI003D764366
MTRTIGRIPRLPPESGLNIAILAMAADISGTREGAEMLAECAETLLANGSRAEALDWFSRIVEGGEPELAPHAALRIGDVLVDEDLEAAQAAWRYATDHGTKRVGKAGRDNMKVLARHDITPRKTPATAEEVVGRAALGRGRLWVAEGDLDAAAEAFGQASDSPILEVAAEGLSYLGSTLSMAGEHERAVPVLERAIATGHRRYGPMAALDLSSILSARGQAGRAVAVLRQAQHGEGWAAAMAAVNVGVLLARELGDLEAGIAELRQVSHSPDPLAAAGGLFNLATLLEENGDADGARQAYQDAADLRQPMFSGKSAVNLGVLLTRETDFRGAEAAWLLALQIGTPEDRARAQDSLEQLSLLGDLDQARSTVEGVDLNDPDLVGTAALQAAEHFLAQGDIGAAVRSYERAMDTGHPLHAAWGAALVGLMFSYEHGSRGAEIGIGRLGEVGLGPLEARAWFFHGVLVMRRGDLAGAESAWRRVARTARDAYPAATCLLWAVHRDPSQAEASFHWVLELAGDLTEDVVQAVLQLGRARAEQGDRAAAREAYELCHRLAGRSGDATLMEQVRTAMGST